MPTSPRFPAALLGAALLLAAPASAAQTLRLPLTVPVPSALPVRAKSLPLSAAFSRTATTPNCVANAFELPGQAWHTDLTGGGISLDAQTLDARPPTFDALYGFPPTWLDGRAADHEVLVIDHFAPAPMALLTGQGVQTLPLNHGALVEAHLRALLESAGFTLLSRQPLRYGRAGRTVTLSRLDLATQVYRTKGLTAGPVPSVVLAQAMTRQLQPTGKSVVPTDLVVNMSFAMIPCQAMTVFRDIRQTWAAAAPPRRYTLNTFLQDVARESGVGITDVQRELTTVSETEPLKRTVADLAAQRRERGASFVAVSSSGNFGLKYATAPGAFPDVISAGLQSWNRQPATDLDGQVWPDAADVTVAGEWFTLPADQLARFCRDGGTCVTDDVLQAPQRYAAFAYRGTSFAAPTLSLFLALQQGRASPCFTPTSTGYRPIQKAEPESPRPAFDFAQAWTACR